MKYLAERFKLLIGTVITDKRRDENDHEKIIIRRGIIENVTDNLIVVRFTNSNGVSTIECFNKGDIISRGVIVDEKTHMMKHVSKTLF